MPKRTRHEVVAELITTHRNLVEARRQLSMVASERESELINCLERIVKPRTGPGAREAWAAAVEDGKRLVG